MAEFRRFSFHVSRGNWWLQYFWCHRFAREKRFRLWKDYVPNTPVVPIQNKEFSGKVSMATLKFNFLCFLFIIICYSAYKQREYKNLTKDTLKPRQTGKSTNSPRRYKWSTFFAPFFNMIGCRSCQCWCVGCQNRWWSTEEDSSLEFKTSKVWTNNDTLNVSPHPASRVFLSFAWFWRTHLCLACAACCLLVAGVQFRTQA